MYKIVKGKFRDNIVLLENLFSEIKFHIREEGWAVEQSERGGVAVINMLIPRGDFEEYDPNEESFVVSTEDLKNFLKHLPDGTIKISREGNQLCLENEDAKFKTTIYDETQVNEFDIEERLTSEFERELEIELGKLVSITESVAVADDTMTIKTEEDSAFTFSAETVGDKSVERTVVGADDGPEVEVKFDVEWITKISKARKIVTDTKLKIGNDAPVKITGKNFDYVIAPRVEER